MLTNDDLQAIKEIVKGEVDPVKERLEGVESRLGKVEGRLNGVEGRLESVEMKIEILNNKIDETQKDTIQILTDVIHAGYRMHDERIVKIEEQLKTSQAH